MFLNIFFHTLIPSTGISRLLYFDFLLWEVSSVVLRVAVEEEKPRTTKVTVYAKMQRSLKEHNLI